MVQLSKGHHAFDFQINETLFVGPEVHVLRFALRLKSATLLALFLSYGGFHPFAYVCLCTAYIFRRQSVCSSLYIQKFLALSPHLSYMKTKFGAALIGIMWHPATPTYRM